MQKFLILGGIVLVLIMAIFSGVIETKTVQYESTGELYAHQVCINHGKSSECFHVPEAVTTVLSIIGVSHLNSEIIEENTNPFGTPE